MLFESKSIFFQVRGRSMIDDEENQWNAQVKSWARVGSFKILFDRNSSTCSSHEKSGMSEQKLHINIKDGKVL